MDQLDTLIRDADPARTTTIPAGDPRAARQLREQLAVRDRRRRRYGLPGGIGLAGAVAAVLVLVVLPGGPAVRPTSAAAEVLTRASAALDQPGAILDIQVKAYSASGRGPAMLGGDEMDGAIMCVPGPCVGPAAAATAQTGISADPSADTLTYSSQEWLSPDGSQAHTVYSNGDETAIDRDADTYTAYDATDNTLTTLTDMGDTATPAPTPPPDPTTAPLLGGLLISNPSDLSAYRQLYQEAQTGAQGTVTNGPVQRTVTAALVGQTMIAGESVYELRFDEQLTLTGVCSPNPCKPASHEALLYLDSQTFLPVRTVVITINPNNNPGLPNGTAVWAVIDYAFTSLPDTTTNQALLTLSPHPGATQIDDTYAQYRSEHNLYPQAGATGSSGAVGSTSASGAMGSSDGSGTAGSS